MIIGGSIRLILPDGGSGASSGASPFLVVLVLMRFLAPVLIPVSVSRSAPCAEDAF